MPKVGHLSTVLGQRDGNLPPKIQNVKCMHMWLKYTTFPAFHIIELPSYAVTLCAHPERRRGAVLPEQLCGAVQPASQKPLPYS